MNSIEKSSFNELEIKKSKFLTHIFIVDSFEKIDTILKEYKQKYKKATHICYAYILNGKKYSWDDGEPGGTAGMPILNVLEKNELDYVLCIVIRYFGGILLGAGGLIRAYTKSATEVLKTVSFCPIICYREIMLNFSYEKEKQINFLLKKVIFINKTYKENVCYHFKIEEQVYQKIEKDLKKIGNLKTIKKDDFL